jgi:ribose transport system permease protein
VTATVSRTTSWVLNLVPALLLLAVFVVFSVLSPRFADPQNALNILVQASSLGIVAAGMTFVLLTAGVDLSVGSIMFLSAAVAGKMILSGSSLWISLLVVLGSGVACGALNALFISGLRVLPFIVTLSTLYALRGLGLYITETRAMNLPDELLRLGTSSWLGVPVPVILLMATLAIAQLVLTKTQYGRQIYAIGNNVEAARKAGIPVAARIASVYIISGFCAALGGIVSVAQLGAVSPTFGNQREFAAIAAAVLGGASLFGGRGSVFPGALLGAVLIQTVESGLVIINADPYLYPMVLAGIIFLAVLLDGLRRYQIERRSRRKIRPAVAAG